MFFLGADLVAKQPNKNSQMRDYSSKSPFQNF